MNIVIGGGSGAVGRALSFKLAKSGHIVKIVTRTPQSEKDISWNTIKSQGLPKNTDAVLNLTGRNIGELNPLLLIPAKRKEFLDDVYNSRINSTLMLTQASTACSSVKTLITASAIGFYKPDLELRQVETTPYCDHDFWTRLCRDWEAAAKISNDKPRPDIKQFQLRIGIVLHKDSPLLKQLYLSHKFGFGGPIASGRQWISWIDLVDLVNLIEFMLSDSGNQIPSGPVNGTSPYPIRQAAFSRALSEAVGAPDFGFRPRLPSGVLHLLLGPERASLAVEGQCVLPRRALDAGFKFTRPRIEDALDAVYGRRPRPVSID